MKSRLFPFLIVAGGLAIAQSKPDAAPVSQQDTLAKALDALKSLEERVALLEQELAEARQRAKAASVLVETEAGADAASVRRPQIEDEEPFDAAKMKASDEAEVQAVAKAVSLLLPDNVKQLNGNETTTPDSERLSKPSSMTVQAGGPKPTRRFEPVIPASMRNSMTEEVNVSVKVYVGANGEVLGTVPVRQGDPTVDQIGVLAAEAVTRWKFEPVRQNGQPIATQAMVRFRFTK